MLLNELEKSIEKKKSLFENSCGRYIVRSLFACFFLSIGTAVAFAVGIRTEEIVPHSGKLLYAFMFSWSLVMILYMNTELGTSNMLYMTVGVYKKKLNLSVAIKILATCLLFNLIGGVVTGWFLAQTGPFQQLPTENFMNDVITAKLTKGAFQIIIEGIFANVLVNTAVLCTLRMKDDGAKVATMLFLIAIFAFMGFEHVIANFPAFSLSYFSHGAAMSGLPIGQILHNILFTLLGNYIGGGLIMGLGYAWLNSTSLPYVD